MTKFTDYLYDLIQNSIEANASKIELSIVHQGLLRVTIHDNGKGMDEATLMKVKTFSYSSRKTRTVGLGLSLIHDLTIQTNGYFEITSKLGVGTTLSLGFDDQHIDFPEMGDIPALIADLYMHQGVSDLVFTYDDLKLDFQSLGLNQPNKTYKQRNQLYTYVQDKLIEVANENTR
jgi:hypothetical protein